MLRRSIAVVLLSFGATHAASALEQRCGGPFDWLFCLDPGLSYSETPSSTLPPPASEGAASDSDVASPQGSPTAGHSRSAASPAPRAPLSLDYRVINHVSKAGTDPRTISQGPKKADGRERPMSKNQKDELYQAFLVWQRKRVINNLLDQSTVQ